MSYGGDTCYMGRIFEKLKIYASLRLATFHLHNKLDPLMNFSN